MRIREITLAAGSCGPCVCRCRYRFATDHRNYYLGREVLQAGKHLFTEIDRVEQTTEMTFAKDILKQIRLACEYARNHSMNLCAFCD